MDAYTAFITSVNTHVSQISLLPKYQSLTLVLKFEQHLINNLSHNVDCSNLLAITGIRPLSPRRIIKATKLAASWFDSQVESEDRINSVFFVSLADKAMYPTTKPSIGDPSVPHLYQATEEEDVRKEDKPQKKEVPKKEPSVAKRLTRKKVKSYTHWAQERLKLDGLYSYCSIPECTKCKDIFKTVPLVPCQERHVGSACNLTGYYPHVKAKKFRKLHTMSMVQNIGKVQGVRNPLAKQPVKDVIPDRTFMTTPITRERSFELPHCHEVNTLVEAPPCEDLVSDQSPAICEDIVQDKHVNKHPEAVEMDSDDGKSSVYSTQSQLWFAEDGGFPARETVSSIKRKYKAGKDKIAARKRFLASIRDEADSLD